jgi:SAM-dependent methyltransferase
MGNAAHWDAVYGKRTPEEQGWYTVRPYPSLDWILDAGLRPEDLVLDSGGGASTLVDHLLDQGLRVAVTDLSAEALELAKRRLGERANRVSWTCGDICQVPHDPESIALWHDRAVFHFLHDAAEREAYRQRVHEAVRPNGVLIMGTFRPVAPPKCSGLPVRHHTVDELAAFFAPDFALEHSLETTHVTPGGVEQAYVFVHLRKGRS